MKLLYVLTPFFLSVKNFHLLWIITFVWETHRVLDSRNPQDSYLNPVHFYILYKIILSVLSTMYEMSYNSDYVNKT